MEISKAVESYLKASRIKEPSKKTPKFYISDMGKCLRVRWLKRKGITSEFAPHVHWIFQIGDMYHDYVYKALEAQGKLLESEDYVEDDHFIGRYDGIVKDSQGKAVLEVKSAGQYAVKKLLGGGGNESDILQGLTYLMMLRKRLTSLERVIYLYINKEVSNRVPTMFLEKHYRLTKQRERKIRDEMDLLVDHWNNDKIPNCTCPAWMKKYNSYQPLCEMKESKIMKVLNLIKEGKNIISTNSELYVGDDKKKEVLKL